MPGMVASAMSSAHNKKTESTPKTPLLGGVSEGRGGFKYALIQNGTKKS